MDKCCNNCKYQSELVLWQNDENGRYLPQYGSNLHCCTVFVRRADGSNTVYGHTNPKHNGLCEIFTPKEKEKNIYS